MTEKRQTSQGYIIRILQHFTTKLWNITNFVMLFQAVMKFLSRLVEIKILSITQVVNRLCKFIWCIFYMLNKYLLYSVSFYNKSVAYLSLSRRSRDLSRSLRLDLSRSWK
jgi:hypothetical protein